MGKLESIVFNGDIEMKIVVWKEYKLCDVCTYVLKILYINVDRLWESFLSPYMICWYFEEYKFIQ